MVIALLVLDFEAVHQGCGSKQCPQPELWTNTGTMIPRQIAGPSDGVLRSCDKRNGLRVGIRLDVPRRTAGR